MPIESGGSITKAMDSEATPAWLLPQKEGPNMASDVKTVVECKHCNGTGSSDRPCCQAAMKNREGYMTGGRVRCCACNGSGKQKI